MKNKILQAIAAALLAAAAAPTGAFAAEYALDLSGADAGAVACEWPGAASLAVGDTLSVALPGGKTLTATVAVELPGGVETGAKTFAAKLADGALGSLVAVSPAGAYVELRDLGAGRLWQISLKGGFATLAETDLTKVGRGGCIELEAGEPLKDDEEAETGGEDDSSASSTSSSSSRRSSRSVLSVPGNPFDDNTVAPNGAPVMVDIMMVFDNGAKAWVDSSAKYSSITNFAIVQVAKMNSVLANTGLHTNFWYRLVDVMTVDTTYKEVDNQILGIVKAGAESGEGVYGPIKARRAACGADLVTYMIDTGTYWGTTGIGYITHGTSYSTWLAYRAWCYSCCAIQSVDLEYTLSHEVGHNMGLAHSPTLASWTKPGTFDYSNGYNFWGKDDNKPYHTIMAYDQDKYYSGYIEVPYFSSPDYTYQGTVIGTVLSNDCTRALRETCSAFANWHDTTIPLPSDVTFSPAGNEAYRITLSNLGGYEIRYTTDGSEPTRESTLYEGPIMLTSGSVTVKAVAVVDENTLGTVAEKTYTASVELDDYVILKELYGYGWSSEYWDDQDGNAKYAYYWNTSSDKTAVVDASGVLTVNRNIDLGMLVANGTNSLEIVATDNALFATNLHVMGNTTLTGDKFSFENWNIHSDSTLTLSPGAGKTLELDKLNTSWYFSSAVLRIGEGTVRFKGPFDGGKGVFGNVQVVVGSGANLELNCAAATGYDMTSPFTVEKGGTVSFNGNMEHMRRPLVLNGGTINASSRFDRMYAAGITVNDDSVIEGNGYMLIRRANESITIAGGKTLNLDINTQDGANTEGWGLVKNGAGEMIATKELAHSGVTAVNAGTFTVAYSSSTKYGTGWSVASGATLKIEDGKFLEVPSLALNEGSILEISASATAPIAVSNSVALVDVILKLNGADDLSYGKEYPVMTASGAFTGVRRIDLSQMPALGDGFAWQLVVDGDTLKARVATTEETESPVPLTSNNDSLAIDVPSDATRIAGGGAMIKSSPIAIDGVNTKVVAMTIDVEIPDGVQDGEKAICSWDLEGNIVRCIRKPSGLLDCYYSDASQTDDRSTEDFTLVPGRHLISVVNRSADDTTYGGTYIYVDGTLAYRSVKLRWGNNKVTRFTIGATAHDTPRYAYEGLNVYGVTVLDLTTYDPLSGMTASGCSPSYGYFNGSYPTVFGLPPAGGFMMNATNLVATLDKSADSISVSVIASFPSSAKGTIFAIWTRPAEQNAYSTAQAEYSGDGTFFLRYNGNTNTNPFTRINDGDSSVDEPHLYTLTYSSENGVCFYQDGIEILHQDEVFKDSGNLALYRVNFGCGAWADANPNPMPDFKVYASHIALGTDDRTVSEDAVKESYPAYIHEESEEDLDPEPPATPATIDVLVAYDKGAQAYVANKGVTLEEFAEAQIAKMNDVLVTNRLDRFYSYRLAGVCKVDGTYGDINSAPGLAAAGVDAAVGLRAAREFYGADTVTLLVDTSGATIGNSSPLSSSSDVASQHECAFSVCSIRAVDTGKQHTMIHENAHNMGCGHARAQAPNICSPFEYGRGFYFTDGSVTRHTIMAYGGDNDASWFFSTTSKEFGFTLGDSSNNNARVLKETCSEVAKWRESVVPGEDDVKAFDENGNEILSDCFFNSSLKVTVEAPVDGAELYYTFDGSEPVVDDEAWHAPSPFTFNFTVDRNLKIAYVDGQTLSPVRNIRFTKTGNVPAEGLWQTNLRYPWNTEGDTIRSYNQTDYKYQCTTPLKATIEGPKRLSFKHRTYFGGVSAGGDNYSHFDVLLDATPVLAQKESTNAWTEAEIDIPDGTHDVVFVFSQRFAMNNPADNKDVTPEADDAVWLKDFAFADLVDDTVLNIPADETVALSDVAASVAAITGEGTLYCGATLPDAKYGFTNATWSGTVAFEGLAANDATKNFQFELYGNAASKVRLTNCAINYLKNNDATFSGTLELVGSAAFSTADGYSSNYNVFGALEGSGSMSFSGAPTQAYIFNTASNFTGSISVNAGLDSNRNAYFGRRIVFGSIATDQDLPGTDKSASITVKSGATAAIGAGATWYAYHGVDIAGVLIVKGAGATLNCEENGAALGLALTDGATLRFETADASLAFSQKPVFTNGTVTIAFADGVAPAAKRQMLVSWNEKPDGNFYLSGLDGWYLEANDDGLYAVKSKPENRLDVGDSGAYVPWDAALESWMEVRGFNPEPEEWEENITWQEFLQGNAANGYSRWQCYVLGLDKTWLADDTLKARVEIDTASDKVRVITAEDARDVDGVALWTTLYGSEELVSPLPFITKEKGTTLERPAGSKGFYKVEVSFEGEEE